MEFEFVIENLENGFLKVNIKEDGIWVSFDEVFGLLENDRNFRSQFINFLKSIELTAFNIECKPVNIENVNQAFEFIHILVDKGHHGTGTCIFRRQHQFLSVLIGPSKILSPLSQKTRPPCIGVCNNFFKRMPHVRVSVRVIDSCGDIKRVFSQNAFFLLSVESNPWC